MRKIRILLVLCFALILSGCSAAQPQRLTPEQYAAIKAYVSPPMPVVKVDTNTDEALKAFGAVAPDAKVVVRHIKNWSKVQIIIDYPGGKPDNWDDMCAALADGTAHYRTNTSAEMISARGTPLASASGGVLRYDAFEFVREPRRSMSHEGDLTEQFDGTLYVSNKSGLYHADGNCPLLYSDVSIGVDVNAAVDERKQACRICAADVVPEAVQNVQREPVAFEFPTRTVEPSPQISTELEEDDEIWVVIPKTGSHYHSTLLCSNMDVDGAHWVTFSEAIERGYARCSNCW